VIALIIVLVLIVLVVIVAIVTFNGVVRLRNRVDAAWSQIDVQLKRRYDLIPNLVETVKGYAAHERQTLEAVIQARNMGVNAQGPAEQAQAENMITGALKSLFALSEAYPDLKANQNFLQLQEELTATEGRIAYARQFYNDTVQRYNTKIQTFPAVIVAGAMNFSPREYFEVDEQSREPVRVSFDTTQPAAGQQAPDQPASADQPPATGTPPPTGQPPGAGQAPQ
jgi:LemA protein